MKVVNAFVVLGVLSLAGCGFNPEPVKQNMVCFKDTIVQAAHGDFSQWTLPKFVPGNHHVPPQIADCMAK